MSDKPRGDLGAAVQMLAADNARLCGIAIAADELVKVVERYARTGQRADLVRALDAYRTARNGN